MAIYQWKGINLQGHHVSGKLQAKDKQEARAILRGEKIASVRLSKKIGWCERQAKSKIKKKQISLFFTQLSTLLESGVPLLQSLHIIKHSYNGHAFEKLINQIIKLVSSGNSLSFAMGEHPKYFNSLVRNLVKTGELTGNLSQLIRQIADYRARKEALLNKTRKALYYPIAFILFALIITITMLLFVVPQFEQLFSSFGAELPSLTKGVIQVSHNVKQHGGLVLSLVTLILLVCWRIVSGSEQLQHHKDRLVLTFPIIGRLLQQAIVTRFCQTLSITLRAGIPIHHAVYYASKATNNKHYQEILRETQKEVESGTSLSQSLATSAQFPDMVVKLIAIGEESGAMDEMLEKLYAVLAQDLDEKIDGLMSLLEPSIIVFLGSVIGGLVMAMYLPIFEIVKVV